MDVALEHDGGSLGTLGGSGMGKSNDLKMIVRLVAGFRESHCELQTVYDSAKRKLICRQENVIGYLFQQYAAFFRP